MKTYELNWRNKLFGICVAVGANSKAEAVDKIHALVGRTTKSERQLQLQPSTGDVGIDYFYYPNLSKRAIADSTEELA